MADAPYKGLTIRFGADTTKFTSSLNAIQRIVGSTQTRLNQLNKAMRGDPTALTTITTKYETLRTQITNAALKVETLRRGIAALNAQGVGELAKGVKNAALNWKLADEAVLRVNKKLNDQYEKLKILGSTVDVVFDKKNISEFYYQIANSEKASERLKAEVDAIHAKIISLKVEQRNLTEERERASKIKDLDDYKAKIAAARSELRGFAAQIIEARERTAALSTEGRRLDALGNEFKELRSESGALDGQLKALSEAMRKNRNDTEAYNSMVNVMAERIRNAKSQVSVLEEQLRLRQGQTGVEHVSESMHELRMRTNEVREATLKAEMALGAYESHVYTAKRSWDSLSIEVRGALAKTKEMTDAQRAQLGITKQQEQEYRKLKQTIDGSEEKLRQLEARAKAAEEELLLREGLEAQKKLQNELTESSAKMNTLTSKTKILGTTAKSSLRDLATGMGATFAPVIMMTGMRIMTAGEQIDTAFRDMRKTVEGTEEDFRHLHDAAIEFSKTHPVSADTILEIEAMGGQLGIAVENLESFATTVSNLDIATNMNADEIALDLGKLANILHLTNDEYDNFADSLVRLGNSEPALESDIMKITTRFSGMAAIVGVLPDEILAIATASTATGQKAEAAGSSLQRTFGRIEGAVAGVTQAMLDLEEGTEEDAEAYAEAAGKLDEYARIAGMSAEDFAALWENNEKLETGITGTTTAFQAFINGLKRIDEEGGSVDATLTSLGITGVRDRQLLEGLTRTTDVLSDSLEMSWHAWEGTADQWGAAGDAAREADKKAQGFSGKLKMLKNTAQDMGDAFASKLLPLMDRLLDLFRLVEEGIENMDDGTAQLITVVGALLVASAPVLRMASQTAITFSALSLSLKKTSASNKAVEITAKEAGTAVAAEGAAANGANKSFKNYISSLGAAKVAAVALAAAGIAILVKAIIDYKREQEDFRRVTVGMKEIFMQTSDAAGTTASKVESSGASYRKCQDDVKKLIEAHERLYDELQRSYEDMQTSVGVLEKYSDVLRDNIDVSADDKLAVQKLKDAVKVLNDQYHMGLEVVELDGKMKVADKDGNEVLASSIDGLVAAKEREIRVNAIAAMQQQIITQQVQDEMKLAEAKKNVAKAQEEYDAALEEGGEYVEEYARNLAEAKKAEEQAQAAYDGSTESLIALSGRMARANGATDEHGIRIQELADKYPLLADRLDHVSDHAFGDFIKALDDAGYNTEALNGLTTAEIAEITNSWLSGTDSWQTYMNNACNRMTADAKQLDLDAVKAFADMKQKSIKEISEMTGISESELEELVDASDASSSQAMLNWVNNIRNSKKKSGDAAELNADAVRDELQKAVEDAKTTGWNIGAGLAIGLENSTYLAGRAGAALAKAAIDAVDATVETGSPSKKTMWTGEMMGLGFVVGMKKEQEAVRKQGELLADLALGAGYAGSRPSIGSLSAMAASRIGGTTNNTTNNSTANEYVNITLNVEARDLQDMNTIDDFLTMVKRSRAQYA